MCFWGAGSQGARSPPLVSLPGPATTNTPATSKAQSRSRPFQCVSAIPQVISRRLACFRVLNMNVSAGHADLCAEFEPGSSTGKMQVRATSPDLFSFPIKFRETARRLEATFNDV